MSARQFFAICSWFMGFPRAPWALVVRRTNPSGDRL
jgi:hypothetical protein